MADWYEYYAVPHVVKHGFEKQNKFKVLFYEYSAHEGFHSIEFKQSRIISGTYSTYFRYARNVKKEIYIYFFWTQQSRTAP